MPEATPVVGAPCWVDLFTSDTVKATEFYGTLLGWEAQPADPRFGGYFVFTKDGAPVAGCMHNDGNYGMPDMWTIYLMTPDVEAVAERAAANGGTVQIPPMVVAENGSMAVVADPGQGRIGVWQPNEMTGFAVIGEPGSPFWFELNTRDYDASVAFYRDVFAWDVNTQRDEPGQRYAMLGQGYQARAGIAEATAFLPEGEPASWSIYFGVENINEAITQVQALGGTVVSAPEQNPFGWQASITDPTGSPVRLASQG